MELRTGSINIAETGAVGDGVEDDSLPIQAALDSGAGEIVIPQGDYRITRTLRVHSRTQISAHPQARLFLCGDTPKKRGDFLLTNADPEGGNADIRISGGIWDGNNTGKHNVKPDLFDKNGYSGSVLNFVGVNGLHLENMVVANSVTYNIRMARLENFTIRNIGFYSREFGHNQDGLHFGGCVRHGRVENIRAISKGQTNDDLIALNADDSLERVENLDLVRGDIEDIQIDNLFAEDCHTLIRLLSVDAAIRDVHIRGVVGGCRCYAINADAARYCRTPLFEESGVPNGVGRIENVSVRDMTAYFTASGNSDGLIAWECNAESFRLDNFRRDREKDRNKAVPSVLLRNLSGQKLTVTESGKSAVVIFRDKRDREEIRSDAFSLALCRA